MRGTARNFLWTLICWSYCSMRQTWPVILAGISDSASPGLNSLRVCAEHTALQLQCGMCTQDHQAQCTVHAGNLPAARHPLPPVPGNERKILVPLVFFLIFCSFIKITGIELNAVTLSYTPFVSGSPPKPQTVIGGLFQR